MHLPKELVSAEPQWVVLYGLGNYEFQSCAYLYEKNALDFLAHVRTKQTHRHSRMVQV